MYNTPYNYLALGDSITVGVGAPSRKGYVDILTYYLQRTYPLVYIKKIAQKGWKSGNLLTSLSKNPESRDILSTANLITLYIGGNDLNFAYVKSKIAGNPGPLYEAVRRFSIQFNELTGKLRTYSRAPILTATLYNPFPNSPLSSQFISLLNQQITSIAQANKIPIADVFNAYRGKEYALIDGYRDGRLESFVPFIQKNPIHPNEWGYKVIADCFFQLLREKQKGEYVVKPSCSDYTRRIVNG